MAYKYDPNAGGDETKEFERPDTGNKAGRCLMVVEMGTVENKYPGAQNATKPDVLIIWELAQCMKDGRPFVVNWKGTFSFGDGAHMTRILKAWRGGVAFTEAEKSNWEFVKLLKQPALLLVSEAPDKKDPNKIWTNVDAVTPLPGEMSMPELINESFYFEIDEIGTDKWQKLYPWVQKMIIEKSEEGRAYLAAHPGFEYGKKKAQDDPAPENSGGESQPAGDPPVKDDEIPF